MKRVIYSVYLTQTTNHLQLHHVFFCVMIFAITLDCCFFFFFFFLWKYVWMY